MYKTLSLLLVILVLFGCKSVNVVDAWKSPNASEFRDNNVLVIARTKNRTARIAFERAITDQLNARGLRCTASFERFPNFDPDKPMTEERKALIETIFNSEGYDAVVVTSLKDVKETTTYRDDYYYPGAWNSYYPPYYGGFYGYYYHPWTYTYSVGISTGPSSYTTKTYYLETVAYDLTKDNSDQLVAVVNSKTDNPSDAYKLADKYAEEILKALE
jgi:hypothetical protein